ncbi:MAG: metallophosphoesterase family protein, partial [Mycobacteriales bacterium]
MLLLHTSDWHLGRSLHRADLRAAQEAFVDHLVEVVRAERVDVVLVSGDVYDRAVPPLDAIALCESAFVRLRDAGAQVVVISGNHDSARRLGFGSALIDSSGVFLRTSLATCDVPVVVDGVPFFAVPYLEPAAV